MKQLSRRMGAWLKTITFYEILVGMKTTITHLLHYEPITQQYPYEKRVLSDNYRGMLALLRYDDGTEKCVGCDLCGAACPSRVISVVSAEVSGQPTKRYSKEYYMDMTRCLFCGMCVDACPVDALGMTREYEWSVYNKRDLLLDKDQLLAIGDRSFPLKEKRIEFQHPNVAMFNVVNFNHVPKDFPLQGDEKVKEAKLGAHGTPSDIMRRSRVGTRNVPMQQPARQPISISLGRSSVCQPFSRIQFE
ncbi:MAG TPA: NADH-quinone oxidoreductase subunit NuoI [Nitrospiraceae bacterium]|nr:NADH-quinone oxidoreductase subunit NuoI [Nitrospiraceae bacterium]